MAEIKVLQNVHCEDLGIIYQVLKNYGFEPRYVQSYAGEAVPKALDDAVALIVMGDRWGSMNMPATRFCWKKCA